MNEKQTRTVIQPSNDLYATALAIAYQIASNEPADYQVKNFAELPMAKAKAINSLAKAMLDRFGPSY